MSKDPEPETELDTWQEIAAYLNISVREAQYREKNDGMPVHRMPGKKSRVRAYRSELDEWKARVSRASGGPSAVRDLHSRNQRLSRRALLGSVVGAGSVLAAGAAWVFRPRTAVPVRAGLVGNTLYAWDESGRELWKHSFSETIRDRRPDNGMLAFPDRQVQITDLHGDGSKQVILVAGLGEGTGQPTRDELYCFSSSGKLLWQYRPDVAVTFGGTRFAGPWYLMDMLVAPNGRQKVIWLALAHWNWMPGAVLALDPQGGASVRFVNAGHIYALCRVSNGGRNYILAGGVNNEYASAALAVFTEDAVPSSSPQSRGSRFDTLDGPKGQPHRYFLLPPSELTMASDKPYNMVDRIDETNDEFLVQTNEITGQEHATAIYRFSKRIEPLDVAFDDSWAARHRRLQKEGKLSHDLDDCPQLSRVTAVRQWDRESAWTTLNVPPSKGVRPNAFLR